MPNGDVSIGEIYRELKKYGDKIDEIIETQEEQGTQQAVMNEHLDNINKNVESNCEDVDLLKKRQRKIIGVGVAFAVIVPLITAVVWELV